VLKVIDQGADDTTNAVSIRKFFARPPASPPTERTEEATSSRPATASPKRR
jgi:alpha-D-ribose 1-methylphosphonate 5-phosphate C-P lyase